MLLKKLRKFPINLLARKNSRSSSSPSDLQELTMNSAHKIRLSERLSKLVRPVNYKLKLCPDLSDGSFRGSVDITVNLREERQYLTLHSKLLDIHDVKVFKDREQVEVSKYSEIMNLEQIMIQFHNPLSLGTYSIQINFSGDLRNKIVGFYSSDLKDRTMVASKFQPTYARQAFPCFDEPEFKATFDITLVKPVNYVALSNMNEVSRGYDEATNTESVTFATSVRMSTYLACFVICDFEAKETTIDSKGIGSNFKLRSFAQEGETHKINFAQDIGKRATEFYIDYYQVPFPLPKLDMIAIPDYVSGATEHWGLITYRETAFLVDEATASSRNKISVANTIAHELAHMWFGNLVTMKWWDDLWLNEGFASYMQVKALNALEPTWTMLDQFLTKTLHPVLLTDAKLSSHPIVQTVDTPDEITAIFDAISYNKGASILRMLESFVGEEYFRNGVTDYLQKHEFGNTVTKDLLDSLELYFNNEHPDLNLTYIMDTWTKQMGYPLLTVKPGDKQNSYVITQARFLIDPDARPKNDSEYQYRWFIPITYKTNKGMKDGVFWFSDKANSVQINLESDEEWLKINNNQVGYYRVNYTADMWNKLIKQLKSKNEKLTISDRAHLINEVFSIADAQKLSYELALNLTTYLKVEQDYVPWEAALTAFKKLGDYIRNSDAYDDFKKYVQHLIRPLYKRQSWERSNHSVIQGLLRTKILAAASKYGLADAEDKVRTMFLKWLNSYGSAEVATVEPDLRDIVYYHGMKSATQAEWDKLWQIYLKEKDAQELSKIRRALAAPRDVDILKKYLTLAWDERYIRSQDYLTVLHFISDNPSGTALIWDHVRNHWPELVERFTLNSRYLGNLIPAITSSFDTEAKLKEMESFFNQYPEAGAGEAMRTRASETLRNNIKWMRSNEPLVSAWLKECVTYLP